MTVPEAGQALGLSSPRVMRLIAQREITAAKDERGWWQVSAASVRAYAERTSKPGAPDAQGAA